MVPPSGGNFRVYSVFPGRRTKWDQSPGTGPILFLLASKTVFFFFAKKKKMGLAPRGQRDLWDLEGPQKPG